MANKINKFIIPLIILATLFTIADGLVHYSWDFLKISSQGYYGLSSLASYMLGKFITTIIAGYIILFFLSNIKSINKNTRMFLFTLVLTIILQIRYFYLDYTLNWHLVNMALHFNILYFLSPYFLK